MTDPLITFVVGGKCLRYLPGGMLCDATMVSLRIHVEGDCATNLIQDRALAARFLDDHSSFFAV